MHRTARKNASVGLLVFLCWCLLSSMAAAQTRDPFSDPLTPIAPNAGDNLFATRGAVLFVTVYGENKKLLDRQAVVKLTNTGSKETKMNVTQDKSEVIFGDILQGLYKLEVTAQGYMPASDEMNIASLYSHFQREIYLKRDPAAVQLEPSGLQLPAKAGKESSRAVAALKNGNWKEGQRHLEIAQRLAPDSPQIAYLLGYLFFQQGQYDTARAHLSRAVKLDSRYVQALALLGQSWLKQDNYAEAARVLEQAVAIDGAAWVARTSLAETRLKQHEYEQARQQAALAVEKSQGRSAAAHLILGTALANLGKYAEGIAALERYLQDAPKGPLEAQVRALITKLRTASADQRSAASAAQSAAEMAAARALSDTDTAASIKDWEPAGVDDARPPVDAGVACPYDTVVARVGERMEVFLKDVARFEAIENVQHDELNDLGQPAGRQEARFDYVAEIAQERPGMFRVDEFRAGKAEVKDFPGQIATRGLPALALVFHPGMRGNFRIACEGLGGWNGRPAWLLYFRQREDRPSTLHGYKLGTNVYSVNLKGRAWVDRETFQIMRIEADMVAPMPEITLLREHQVVDYGPVTFKDKSVELWLPKKAELYFNFRRHRYMRRHTFENFLLFSVDADAKDKAPVAAKE